MAAASHRRRPPPLSFPSLIPLLLLSFLTRGNPAAAAGKCHPDDQSALLDFKSAITADPTGMLATWKPDTDCCESWVGITCRAQSSRVRAVSLFGESGNPASSLAGTIPLSFSKLTGLTDLHLVNLKNLAGPFPAALLRMPGVVVLYLTDAQLSGELPAADIAKQLPNLADLRLSRNRFTGRPLPSLLSTLTSRLQVLDLSYNDFTGDIPAGVVKNSNLASLILDGNSFYGRVPDLSSLHKLQSLSLSQNRFNGAIPALPRQTSNLNLAGNFFGGSIPSHLGNLATVDTLDLSNNFLKGTLPSSLVNLRWVSNFNLSNNFLEGSAIPAISSTRIRALDLSSNKFTFRKLPAWIGKLPSVERHRLRGCGLSTGLEEFDAATAAGTSNYQYLDLSNNNITGSPESLLAKTTGVIGLRLSENKLSFDMGKLKLPSSLKSLDISDNLVYGSLPPEISRLEKLDVSSNQLCGPIPPNNFPASAFANNKCLCGSPLPPCSRRRLF